jgi:hypothetical protein
MDRQALGSRDRRALAATAGQFFVNGAMTASFIAQAPQIRDRIGVTVEGFGLLLTVSAVFGLMGTSLRVGSSTPSRHDESSRPVPS